MNTRATRTAADRLRVAKDNVMTAARMLQNDEPLVLAAMLRDKGASDELRTLAADLFSLLDVMVTDERERTPEQDDAAARKGGR